MWRWAGVASLLCLSLLHKRPGQNLLQQPNLHGLGSDGQTEKPKDTVTTNTNNGEFKEKLKSNDSADGADVILIALLPVYC